MAVYLSRRAQKSGALGVKFTLPGNETVIDYHGEIAWDNGGSQVGIRFVDLAAELRTQLKTWLARHSPDIEKDRRRSRASSPTSASAAATWNWLRPFRRAPRWF